MIVIYTFKEQERAVRQMMAERHPEAKLAAVDSHFINPFAAPSRDSETADGLLQKE